MKKLIIILLLCITFILPAKEKWIIATVLEVYDGDTIKIDYVNNLTDELVTVRLIYIDAPEKKQQMGVKSQLHLKALLLNQQVIIKYNTKKLTYGRIVGEIWLMEDWGETSVNQKMIRDGYAFVYVKYFLKREADFMNFLLELQNIAVAEKRGIWINGMFETPEKWRRKK